MNLKRLLLSSAGIATSVALCVPVMAQNDSEMMETVVVTGVRASIENALDIKKNTAAVVDSIIAEDIGKFPDLSVADSLQRITGVQITRDYGEGNGVAIRGLTQVETTLNGHEIYTASGGRSFNLSDMPAELVSGVDVFKTTSADRLEGGIGGAVDIRTRHPFDMDEATVALSGRLGYGDLMQAFKPSVSALVSDRWNTSIGDIGALLSMSFQQRAFREAYDSAGATTANTYAISGQSIAAPNGFYNPTYTGHRDRLGINGSVQWRPTSELEFTVDANFMRYMTYQNQYIYSSYPSFANSVPGTFTTFPGTNDLATGTYANPKITTSGVSRDNTDQVQNYVVSGRWDHNDLTITSSVQYGRSDSNLFYTDLDLTTNANTVTFDLTTKIPSYWFTGVDLTNLSNYKTATLTYSVNFYHGTQLASKADAQWRVGWGPLKEIDAGVRYSVLDNSFAPIRMSVSTGAKNATDYAQLLKLETQLGWPSSVVNGEVLPQAIWVADPEMLRANINKVETILGLTTQPTVNPLSVYTMSERTTNGYLMAKIDTDFIVPITGDIGLRVTSTSSGTKGYQTNVVNGVVNGYKPIDLHDSYTDLLPSVNLVGHITDELQLHVSASKTINRPSFSNMTPGLTLVPYNGSGSSGNPYLKPMYATQYDASIEYYFSKSDSVYLASFYKTVKNFVLSKAVGQVIDGVEYNITQPVNTGSGTVKGFEFGYTQFYDFLPGLLSGFGTQANFTYVDSSAPSSVAGYSAPLSGLSRYNFNVVGMYEKGPVSARVAYNWRSKYFSSLYAATGVFAGYAPVYQASFGWLDASLSYDVQDNLTISLEGSNLLHTVLKQYYTVEDRPANVMVNDRQFLIGVRYKL